MVDGHFGRGSRLFEKDCKLALPLLRQSPPHLKTASGNINNYLNLSAKPLHRHGYQNSAIKYTGPGCPGKIGANLKIILLLYVIVQESFL